MSTSGPTSRPLHVVFDACAAQPGSVRIVLLNLLRGWRELAPGDRLTVVRPAALDLDLPDGVEDVILFRRFPGRAGSAYERSLGVRAACRELRPDAVISAATASAVAGAARPHAVLLYDLRHEVLPRQFSRGRRWARKALYAWSFERADRVLCISERTREDLVTSRPRLRDKAVVTLLGADHVDSWPMPNQPGPRRYALAFGHFANKNAERVISAWALVCRAVDDIDLCLVGMSSHDRSAATAQVNALGISDRVELAPWLDDGAFHQRFAGAALIVFPSSFEGFGLPAVEALRRRIPLVVSGDRALAEVTGGHATVASSLEPRSLADAMEAALSSSHQMVEAAAEHVAAFTWSRTAAQARAALFGAGAGSTTLP